MMRFLSWFYHVCLRMNDIRDGKNITEEELPSAADVAELDRQYRIRTGLNRPSGH